MDRPLHIEVKDSVFDPNQPPGTKQVYVRTEQNQYFYKVWLFLDGRDLPYVQSVTYTLHPTFSQPVRTVRRTPENPNCQLVLWTWSVFAVNTTIEDKQGGLYEVVHALSYDKQLAQEGIEYTYEDDALRAAERPQLKRTR